MLGYRSEQADTARRKGGRQMTYKWGIDSMISGQEVVVGPGEDLGRGTRESRDSGRERAGQG